MGAEERQVHRTVAIDLIEAASTRYGCQASDARAAVDLAVAAKEQERRPPFCGLASEWQTELRFKVSGLVKPVSTQLTGGRDPEILSLLSAILILILSSLFHSSHSPTASRVFFCKSLLLHFDSALFDWLGLLTRCSPGASSSNSECQHRYLFL